ncbi:threonine-phosphate decarboxylase [Gloeocapsopsis sp. AAB1 = 1H9]|uniref:threonine-phosphate decarboxylase n=2 Tax=Gloeocapsopsis TaxID=693222 RepID=A0A6N8FSS9_9CHRO|nr:threonine-phosphate decarboxylase [Gloeocapsopsis dulcis AAB1 = 1H9]
MRPIHGGNLAWAAAVAGCSPSEILDFSASINPLGPPKSAIAAIQAHLGELSAYPDPNYGELRTALGQSHQLPPEWILPGNGSAELLTWAGWDLAQFAKTFLFTPAFADYYRALKAFGAKVQQCPLELEVRGDVTFAGLNVSTESSLLPTSECGLLLNNPHNPTGQMFSRETILPYLEQFALVVVDEAFMDFLPPDEAQSLIPVVQEYPNLVILRSLTKFYSLPGLRLGYAIAHPDRLQSWQQRRDPWSINTLAAAAAVAVIQDREFQQQTWKWLPSARIELFEGLSQISGLQPYRSSANFLLVQTEHSSSALQKHLLQHHRILVRDCLSFPVLGDRFFRVAVRSNAENKRLLQALLIAKYYD